VGLEHQTRDSAVLLECAWSLLCFWNIYGICFVSLLPHVVYQNVTCSCLMHCVPCAGISSLAIVFDCLYTSCSHNSMCQKQSKQGTTITTRIRRTRQRTATTPNSYNTQQQQQQHQHQHSPTFTNKHTPQPSSSQSHPSCLHLS